MESFVEEEEKEEQEWCEVSCGYTLQLVQVTYVLNPNHFYVRYRAKGKEAAMLTQKITELSSRPSSCSQVFVRKNSNLWCRGTVVCLSQIGVGDVTSCPAHLLTEASVFLPDYGETKTVYLDREPAEMDKIVVMKKHLRKMDDIMKLELNGWSPLAVRCSLNLVPDDMRSTSRMSSSWENSCISNSAEPLTMRRSSRWALVTVTPSSSHILSFELPSMKFGSKHQNGNGTASNWRCRGNKAQRELRRMVRGSALLEMQLFSQEEDILLVDLWKPPTFPAVTCPVSVREYLVFRHLARSQSQHSAMVTHINTPQDFYIQLVTNMEFQLFNAKLQTCYEAENDHSGLQLYSPAMQQACVVRHHDNLWYRARITGEMQFQLEVRVLEWGLQGPQVDLATLLVSEHLACYRDASAGPRCDSEPTVCDPPFDSEEGTPEAGAQPPASQDPAPRPQLQLPTVLEKNRVKVTHVTSPSSFYVQLVKNEPLLKWMCEHVQESSQGSAPQDVVWKKNMFCCALVNGFWERAQILADLSSDNIAEVQRCDFGSRVKLHVSSLQPLPPTLEGSVALECRLADIRGSRLDSHGELTEERPLPVSLFYPNQAGKEVNLADFLTNKGLALKERKPRLLSPEQQLTIREESSALMSILNPTCTTDEKSQLEMLRTRIQGRMKTVPQQKSYTWKSVLGCALMGADMLWYRAQVLQVFVGMVKVRYVDLGTHGDHCHLQFHVYPMLLCEEIPQLCVPCHLNAVIPVGRVWQKDTEVPADPRGVLTVEVFLDGLSLNTILCDQHHIYMDEKLLSQQAPTSKPCLPSLDNWDISTEGLDSPQQPPLGPFIYSSLPPEGSRFRVKFKHLCTPNEVFLWPLGDGGVEADEDDDLDQRINADVDQLPCLSDFPLGGGCLAEYSDGRYYRAKLIEFTSLDPIMITVQHVDFGSYDTLPTSNIPAIYTVYYAYCPRLREMPAELLRFPVRALKIKVGGFQPPRILPNDSVLPYSPQWTVDALIYILDSLHSQVTASVVSREPELTVLLYDEHGQLLQLPQLPLVSSGLADPQDSTPGTPHP
ncbi:hypothetical protein CRUP_026971 [Coryphaenoides rupestris]|nr:hypothetical protein CRUP_026971 [Coryphaenoides rupestris]